VQITSYQYPVNGRKNNKYKPSRKQLHNNIITKEVFNIFQKRLIYNGFGKIKFT